MCIRDRYSGTMEIPFLSHIVHLLESLINRLLSWLFSLITNQDSDGKTFFYWGKSLIPEPFYKYVPGISVMFGTDGKPISRWLLLTLLLGLAAYCESNDSNLATRMKWCFV